MVDGAASAPGDDRTHGMMAAVTPEQRLRQVVNLINLSTPLGLLIARVAGTRLAHGPDGLLLAYGYRLALPSNSAFTVGNVVLLRGGESVLEHRPTLLAHEARHASQYAVCVGPMMWPLYALAAGWSWVRTGDPASRNVFERRAGLADGGYRERPLRRVFRRPGSSRF
jgi:hypothetical protein